jgi:hypothetical protein
MVIAMSCEGVNALYWEFARDVDDPTRMLLGVETVCLVAFGVAWIVKEEVIPA